MCEKNLPGIEPQAHGEPNDAQNRGELKLGENDGPAARLVKFRAPRIAARHPGSEPEIVNSHQAKGDYRQSDFEFQKPRVWRFPNRSADDC